MQRSAKALLSPYARPIRDLANGRVRDYDLRLSRFEDADWRRYARLLGVAFTLAVGRRFRPGQDRAPVIRFVASVREQYDHTGYDIDAGVAETLVWAALGERPAQLMTRAAVTAQTLLLIGLLADTGTCGADLDAFLRLAEDLVRPDDPTTDDVM